MPENLSVMEMSLRDVEPVKSFIDDMINVRNGRKLAGDGEMVEAMDAAFRRLYHGFGSRHDPRAQGLKESRGWRIPSDRVPRISDHTDWPAVGIVIPVYNAPALLRKCLVSLMRTDYPGAVYHTLVDNASTDKETLQILGRRDFLPIRFDEPVGFAEAVNAGIRAIREHCPEIEYVVLMNQDCRVVDEDWLKYLINWMESRPGCAVAGAKLIYPDGRLQHAGLEIPKGSCGRHRYLHGDPDAPEVNCYEKMQSVTGAVYAIRASVLDEISYLDERYKLGCEDTEYSLRVAQHGHEVWYVPDSVVVHEDNAVKKANSRDRERIRDWQRASDHLFRTEYGRFVDRCDGGQVAFVLPDWNPVAGGCRVVGALANVFINAGMETAVYVQNQQAGREDPDFPQLFEIKPLSKLKRADILVATRYDTVANTKHVMADRKFYLVQADERPMAKYCHTTRLSGGTEADVIRSYQQIEYEIITIGEHLREMLAGYGRTCGVLDVGLYRDLYPYVECGEPNKPFRILMYMTSADYKGGEDLPGIAHAIREHLGDRVKICSFHRDFGQPGWADDHFRPKSTSEVGEVYCWHDCYVYASHSDGFAMTPVEAMACGTPVILTDFPGKDQYALDGRNCLVVPFRNFHAIAEAVERLIENPGLWRGLSAMGAQTAKRLDWSVVGRQWLRAILEAPSYV